MILSDASIRESVQDGEIGIEPEPSSEQYQPASLDLRLGEGYYDVTTGEEDDETSAILIRPQSFYLCHTKEEIRLPSDICAKVSGRSSIGREGVIVHATAGWVDPGFTGSLTLEVYNFSNKPVTLYADERVCQLSFFLLDRPAEVPYGEERDSKYQGQTGVTPSRR